MQFTKMRMGKTMAVNLSFMSQKLVNRMSQQFSSVPRATGTKQDCISRKYATNLMMSTCLMLKYDQTLHILIVLY